MRECTLEISLLNASFVARHSLPAAIVGSIIGVTQRQNCIHANSQTVTRASFDMYNYSNIVAKYMELRLRQKRREVEVNKNTLTLTLMIKILHMFLLILFKSMSRFLK